MSSSLGSQCWSCRRRRVHCDLKQPHCSKCLEKGLECPGYSASRPLRWRHQVTKKKQSEPKIPKPNPAPVEKDVAPFSVITDALTYYNAKIVPDLAADGASAFYIIDISKWHEFNISKRHLTLCLVTLHRAVLEYGDAKHNQALFHYHQACAAEILKHKIRTLGQVGPDPELFEDVSLFFFSQIQASAYGAWRVHLRAAKTLFNLWGVEALMGSPEYEFFLCHLVLADVFGTAMEPASHITVEDVKQHQVYLGLLGRFNVDVCSTMVPIPEPIVRTTATINMLRAAQKDVDVHFEQEREANASSVDAVLNTLKDFDPTDWALHPPRHTSSQATSWALLAICFQAASVFYLVRTSDTATCGSDAELFYSQLKSSIRELYELRKNGGVLYKYILWPMVVCGVEAVFRQDDEQLQYLSKVLEETTIDLGTLSMREASQFLNKLWIDSTKIQVDRTNPLRMDWDTIFDRAPLFLM